MLVFWTVMLCGLVGRYQRFVGNIPSPSLVLKIEAICFSLECWYLLEPTSQFVTATQNTNINIFTVVRTSSQQILLFLQYFSHFVTLLS
jgi:hypothetical protein